MHLGLLVLTACFAVVLYFLGAIFRFDERHEALFDSEDARRRLQSVSRDKRKMIRLANLFAAVAIILAATLDWGATKELIGHPATGFASGVTTFVIYTEVVRRNDYGIKFRWGLRRLERWLTARTDTSIIFSFLASLALLSSSALL